MIEAVAVAAVVEREVEPASVDWNDTGGNAQRAGAPDGWPAAAGRARQTDPAAAA